MRILILSDYYLPGYKAGGPIRALASVVDRLGNEFDFTVVTRDRDYRDVQPYDGIAPGSSHCIGKTQVIYLDAADLSLRRTRHILGMIPHDALYLNSLFSPRFAVVPLLLRRLGLILKMPVILAPRGELARSALSFKSLKKHAYLVLARAFGVCSEVVWQAGSTEEQNDIRRWFGSRARVLIAPDPPQQLIQSSPGGTRRQKVPGRLRIVFLSRISPVKNLDGALAMLDGVRGEIDFDIYGPVDDWRYWRQCEAISRSLPSNVRVRFQGSVRHETVMALLLEYDLFFLPTRGESFGYAVLEALAAGCPVLTSDRTRWRGLESKGVGWDLALERPDLFRAVLQKCVDMETERHREWSDRARAYGVVLSQDDEAVRKTRALFKESAEAVTRAKKLHHAMEYVEQPLAFRLKKAIRYVRLYGFRRTLKKIEAHYHYRKTYRVLPPRRYSQNRRQHVGIIGCGKFAYSMIAYYLTRRYGRVIRASMDSNVNRAASLFDAYGLAYYTDDAAALIDDPRIDLIFIASNHASHAEYAIEALRRGKSVHIEKPHVVRRDQLIRLCAAMAESTGKVALGFNRPVSRIGREIKRNLDEQDGPAMYNWFVAGHEIPPEHWYFREEEGGRVLGNLCHWTDFMYQLVAPENRYPITIRPTKWDRSDCDIAVTYTFGDGSIAAITFSAKGHSFEGVRERFAAHRGSVLILMDDFRTLTVDILDGKRRISLRHRDHGHEDKIRESYEMVRPNKEPPRYCSVSYVWETGDLFLQTRTALEHNEVITLRPYEAGLLQERSYGHPEPG